MDAGLPVATMAVNVSAMEFQNENFLRNLTAILGRNRPRPELSRARADGERSDEAGGIHGIHPSIRESKRGTGGGR